MTLLSVWAPNANQVEVEMGTARYPMTAGESGWWITELKVSESNADYMFVLDGGQPLPDRVLRGSRAALMDPPAFSITMFLTGRINAGRRRRFRPPLSTSFILAPSLRKEPSPRPSTSSITWLSSA
jgi:hypothetical protein